MQTRRKQKGAALLLLVVLISLLATLFTLKLLNENQYGTLKKEKTAKVLFEAKNALLGWSVIQGRPGLLPCPENAASIGTLNEGEASPTCNSTSPVVGRLPWKALNLGDIRDGNGDRLWYALSPGFSDTSVPISPVILGQINVDTVTTNLVAVIFSPGVTLVGGARPTPTNLSPPVASDYLDLTNNDGDFNFLSTGPVNTFNDELLLVSHTDLFSLVAKRILREVRGDNTQGLVRFSNENPNYAFADTDANGTSDGANIGTPSYTNSINANDLFFDYATHSRLVNNGWMQEINYELLSSTSVRMSLNGQTLMVP